MTSSSIVKGTQITHGDRSIDVRAVAEIFIIHQFEKMSISLGKDEIPRLYYLSSRYLDGRIANQGST